MNLNKITFNEQLSLQTQTEQPIRAFASQANTIEVLAPVSEYNTAYIVLQGLKDSVVNPKLRQTQRLYMSRLSDSGVYRRWNMVIPGAILNDMSLMNSTGVRVKVEFWYIEGDHLGVEKYNTTNAATIASNLATDYPSAEDGQFVRVIDTNTDWVYDLATTTWEDYGTQKLVGIQTAPTDSVDFTLEQGTYTDEPTHAPTNTELILQELGLALKKSGGVMTGDIDMDGNNLDNVGGITLYSATGTAVLKYDGTDLILNRNAVDEKVLTELTTLDELYNVIETAIADDDILIRSGANYVNVSKADFLQAVTDRLTTNEISITTLGNEKEDVSNKIITWGTPTNTEYPSAKLVKDTLDLKTTPSYVDTNISTHNVDTDAHANRFYLKADLVGGTVPSSQLPSYIDHVIEVATYADLPATGEEGIIYVVIADETTGNDQSIYRWSGTVYVLIHDEMDASEIKTLYESNDDTNVFTDALKNKLAGIASGAEVNVNADWDAISGDAQILNKPTLATVATSGSYVDLSDKPAIPTKVSDLTNDTGYITEYTETDPFFTAWDKSTGISITKSQITDFPTSMPPTEHNHDSDYYKKSETYSKTEIDTMIGDIDTILDSILGV